MILLSVIIPFFNTFSRSEKVLKRVSDSLNLYSDIEFILVDDGSTDDTLKKLKECFINFEKNSCLKIFSQENKGPGGARNTGLKVAVGKYVWFVDSDDDFYIDKIYKDLEVNNECDFIDYNYIESEVVKNSMNLQANIYCNNEVDLYSNLGRLWTKVFKREFFVKNNIKYPENCIYEDNYFIYVLPFLVKKFIKSEKAAYYYETDVSSVTRDRGFNKRYFDRLITSYNGLVYLNNNNFWNENYSVHIRFKEVFLYNTVLKILINMDVKNLKYFYYILCTYNYLELKYYIKNETHVENKAKAIINVLRYIFPKKNYMPFFFNLNKEQWNNKI